MQEQIRILSTKKLQPNQKQFLFNAGFSVIEADFISIKNKKTALKATAENLIFTSQKAVNSILENEDAAILKDKNCFCVGEKTKSLLEQNGFNVIACSDNASDLADIIKKDFKTETFTFFSGNTRLETLPLGLKMAGISFNEKQVYDTVLEPKRIKTNANGILFFSPSAVESYLSANDITNETCFCIGKTTAKALEQKAKNIVIANKPSMENVVIQCINHYKK